MLIAIEGIDASGKHTQSKRLAAALNAAFFSFPDYESPCGREVGKYLKRQGEYADAGGMPPYAVGALYALDRAQYKTKLSVAQHVDVVCDRYVESNVAYQAGRARFNGADADAATAVRNALRNLEYEVLGLPRPLLNILIDVPVEVAVDRLTKRGKPDANERADFLNHVRRAYHELAGYADDEGRGRFTRDRGFVDGSWAVIDGDRDPDAVAADVLLAARWRGRTLDEIGMLRETFFGPR